MLLNFKFTSLNSIGFNIKTSKSPTCSFHRISVYVDLTCDNAETTFALSYRS